MKTTNSDPKGSKTSNHKTYEENHIKSYHPQTTKPVIKKKIWKLASEGKRHIMWNNKDKDDNIFITDKEGQDSGTTSWKKERKKPLKWNSIPNEDIFQNGWKFFSYIQSLKEFIISRAVLQEVLKKDLRQKKVIYTKNEKQHTW